MLRCCTSKNSSLTICCTVGLIMVACAQIPADSTPPITSPTPDPTSQGSENNLTFESVVPPASPTQPPVADVPMEGPLVTIVNLADRSGALHMLNAREGLVRRLEFEGGHPIQVQWTASGCQLYVTLRDVIPSSDSYKIVHTDLEGNILEEVIKYSLVIQSGEEGDIWRVAPTLSPTGDWLASVYVSGELGIGGEISKIEVLSTHHGQERHVLGSGGSAGYFAWSPDGQRLAYSDRDAAGIRQLYVSDLDGTDKVQLTYFTEPDLDIPEAIGGLSFSTPVWSPDGRLLAFHYRLTDESSFTTGAVWIVSSLEDKQVQVAPENLPHVWITGWSDDSSHLAFYVRRRQDGGGGDDAVFWTSATDGTVWHVLDSSQLPEQRISWTFPVGGIQVVGIHPGGSVYYLYDSNNETLKKIPYPISDRMVHFEPYASPNDFPGETACKDQADTQAP